MFIINKFHQLPAGVKKSFADQVKLLSWALGSVNGYFRQLLGDFVGVSLILVGWVLLQFLAHYLVYSIKKESD